MGLARLQRSCAQQLLQQLRSFPVIEQLIEMAVDNLNSSGSSQWHAVRPWTPRFVLTVREVTSVSATFILSSDLSTSADPPLASLGLAQADDDDGFEDVPLVSDAPWQRTIRQRKRRHMAERVLVPNG